MAFAWNEETEAELKRLYDDGLSGAAIARRMGGGLTRTGPPQMEVS